MKRALFALPALLLACAPVSQQREAISAQPAALPFQADFSDAGVTWVSGGQAYVARAPALSAVRSPLPVPAVAAAWVGNAAWGALPAAGLVVTLDGPPEQTVVGRAVKLSRSRVYLEGGGALSYQGGALSGFLGTPDSVITVEGQDYALIGAKLYQSGSPPTLLSGEAGPNLYATARGVATAGQPTAEFQGSLYRLTGSELQRLSGTTVVAAVPHGPGLLGVVGGKIVTLSPQGTLRRFNPALQELSR